MRIKPLFVGLALLSFTPNLHAQQLSSAEKKLVESVDAHAAEEIVALEKVVNMDSGTFNTTGVREVGRYFQQELESLGFKTRWISMPEEMRRAGHLIAEHVPENSRGNRVLLIGHMDTVFEGQGHRFERSGDTVSGAGSMDMKGGDIALLYALKALQSAGMLDYANVRVFLTGDEFRATARPREDQDQPARAQYVVSSNHGSPGPLRFRASGWRRRSHLRGIAYSQWLPNGLYRSFLDYDQPGPVSRRNRRSV